MDTGRRSLLAFVLALAGLVRSMAGAQMPQAPETRPPKRPEPFPENPEPPTPKVDTHSVLKQNQKEIKEDVEKLFKLAGELRKEVNKTDSAEILSLDLVHKADEVEKLARQIKNLARG